MKPYSILSFVLALFMTLSNSALAQNSLNAKRESILGNYFIDHSQFKCKVKITCESDGTYKAQVFHVDNPVDPDTGMKLTDIKNPDKSMRSTPCDKIVLLYGLKYNEKDQCWDRGKVYDPTCGIKANAKVEFVPDGRLKVQGSLFGVSEHVFWSKIE